MKTLPFALLAAAGCLALAAGSMAAPAPEAPEPDTVILSDTLHYDDLNKTSTFTGNVILTRGAMTLRAAKLVTREDAQGNQFGTATAAKGESVTIHQENPEKFETLVATGLQADYAGQSGDITLTGQATVTRQICGQAVDNVRGARIVYHQKSGTYEAFGGKDSAAAGGRVRSLAQPQSRIDQAIAQCKAGKS
ncbi:lipopolysaccharide transport periplasmic protein LptA [Castellaniella hirudinis]|uniref:lipopolysaccharide transport periplasmic protein LptA n=1 Tax=Castellaniella hirudinis TaxID=1144617 RepID=UPI0039C05D77